MAPPQPAVRRPRQRSAGGPRAPSPGGAPARSADSLLGKRGAIVPRPSPRGVPRGGRRSGRSPDLPSRIRAVKVLFATQGKYGERIADYIAANRPEGWEILRLPLRRGLPMVIDDPDEVLPAVIPPADLLVSLHESSGAAELIPDIAQRCGAAAVLAAVDDRAACPRGLENQIGKRLGAMGVAFAFARPLCGFDGGPHPLLSAFAERFGRPRMRIDADGDRVGLVTVERDCPCGAGRFVAKVLPGTRLSEAADTGALRHHHHPCMASMEVDPELSDTLMHLSGYIFRAAINAAIRKG
ncbi:MAG: hypothetical protein D4R80_08435 [Deltaproteobacteria bacterium]|nr:MAG: hypothetical protein D4R80_08435 [Deltaproteobacteria bacterium]